MSTSRRTLLLTLFILAPLLACNASMAEPPYESDWDSLATAPVPQSTGAWGTTACGWKRQETCRSSTQRFLK